MFESPLEWCSMCKDWVALDQSFEEHVRECGCSCNRNACPLAALFRPSDAMTEVLQHLMRKTKPRKAEDPLQDWPKED